MSKQKKAKESDWKKIGPCLYRYRDAKYYGLFKILGKQIRKSLETEDLAYARRKLPEKRVEVEKLDQDLGRCDLDGHKDEYLKTITGATSTVDCQMPV